MSRAIRCDPAPLFVVTTSEFNSYLVGKGGSEPGIRVQCWKSDSDSLIRDTEFNFQVCFSRLCTMFRYVRIWSNLRQISAFVEDRIMDMPKTMRIFAYYIYTRASVSPEPRLNPGQER